MTKIIALITLCFSLSLQIVAKDNYTKQEKAAIKVLKKLYKPERIELHRPYSDFKYYEIVTKDYRYMIADSTGNVILPQSQSLDDAFKYPVKFTKRHKKGYANYRGKGRGAQTVKAYYTENKDAFMTQKSIGGGSCEYKFYSVDGNLMAEFDGKIEDANSSPVYISKDLLGGYGLLSLDGSVILPNDYSTIIVDPDGLCSLSQIKDGIERCGGFCFSDKTTISVPCDFYSVIFDDHNSCWNVQIHVFDSIMTYKDESVYDVRFLDEGQRLYELQEYDNVRKFYSLNADSSSWAKFYIGASYYSEALCALESFEECKSILERSYNKDDRSIASSMRNHFSEVKTKFALSDQSLKAYLENDNRYASHANEMLYTITSFRTEEVTNKESMNLTIADFERRCSEYEQEQREAYRRELEQQRLNIERQKLNEQRLAREQKEREIRMRQKAEIERKQREAKKKEEEKKKGQKDQNQTTQQQPKPQNLSRWRYQQSDIPRTNR